MRTYLFCLLAVVVAGCTSTTGTAVLSGPAPAADAITLTWTSRVIQFSREAGRKLVFDCPRGGRAERITGTDVYGETSSVCTAAVHAGLITLNNGGRIVVEVLPGRESFSGSSRNGITSLSYGRMTNSFAFVR